MAHTTTKAELMRWILENRPYGVRFMPKLDRWQPYTVVRSTGINPEGYFDNEPVPNEHYERYREARAVADTMNRKHQINQLIINIKN